MQKLYRSHAAFPYTVCIPRACKTSFMYTKQTIGFWLKGEQLLEGQLSVICQEAEVLAFECERVRASLPLGDERTQKMEAVGAKMRTIGRTVYPRRHELAGSPLPGKRLEAIAALQVVPDYDMFDWLASRKGEPHLL